MKFVLFKRVSGPEEGNEDILAINPLTIMSIEKFKKGDNTKCYLRDINNDDLFIEGSLESNIQKINEALNNTFIRT